MLFAGIAWDAGGFEVAFRNPDGTVAAPERRFPAGGVAALTGFLCELAGQVDELICIVDSTNGMLDGGLMVRGLRVHRADPAALPPRPAFGSVPADTLARAGAERLAELDRLTLTGGSLTGRSEEHGRDAGAREQTLASLVADGRCLARGASEHREVALTFDDGPNPPYTGRILDVLEEYDVPATFFCIGLHAQGHAEELARMTEAGHLIGNHTWSHPFLPDLTHPELERQLLRTDEAIERVTGPRPQRFFRPPYGSGTPHTYSWLGQHSGSTLALWDVDTNDWAMPGADAISRTVLARVRPGSIVLMHDGGGDRSQTAEALPAVVEGLLERGYRFVTVEQLADGQANGNRKPL